ncbi:Pentatricopeptide repeat-containing protein [Drosera capensis]
MQQIAKPWLKPFHHSPPPDVGSKHRYIKSSLEQDEVDGGTEIIRTKSPGRRDGTGEVGRQGVWKREREKGNNVLDEMIKEMGDDGFDELGVGMYGVRRFSSVESCNNVLRRLEKGKDSEALRFFLWMRRNGKLKGNVMGYCLVLRVLGRRGDWDGAEKLVQEMKAVSDCVVDRRVFKTVIYACSKRGNVEVGARWFRFMLENDIEPDVATIGMVMSLYQKGWNAKEAEFVFSLMRDLNLECLSAYSSMITIYTRLGLHSKAEEVVGLLNQAEVKLNLENWLVMLNSYCQQGKLEQAESTLFSMQKAGFPPNIVAYNTMITGYGRVSNMDDAEAMFHSLEHLGLKPDETTYRSMIEGYARAGNSSKAQWYYEELRASGFKPNSANLFSLINLHAKFDNVVAAIGILDDMVKMGCQASSILSTVLQAYERAEKFHKVPLVVKGSLYKYILVSRTACSVLVMAYVKQGLVDAAMNVLEEKQWKDRRYEDNLYHLLICSCKEFDLLDNAVKIFTHLPRYNDNPNLHIVSTMIGIYSSMNRFSDAENLYQKVKSSGVEMDLLAFSVVVRMYAKAGSLDDACLVLDAMENQKNIIPDVYLIRDMLRIYQKCDKQDKLAELYYKILKSGVTWDQEMYNCVINCCAHALPIDELSRVFDEMIQHGFIPNTITYNVMLDVHGKAKQFNKAWKVLNMAKKQGLTDAISYSTLIAAYGKSKDLENMRLTVKNMQFNGFSVTLEVYNSMLDAYGKEKQMENLRNVLQRMKDSNCYSDSYTYNILINIYGEQGWIEEVAAVLTELKEYGPGPDLCSYNTLIKAYGIAGLVEDAVSVIKEMLDNGINPDKITYLNLITALKRNDSIFEAVKWSLWMKQLGFS